MNIPRVMNGSGRGDIEVMVSARGVEVTRETDVDTVKIEVRIDATREYRRREIRRLKKVGQSRRVELCEVVVAEDV